MMNFGKELKDKNLKITPQRTAILDEIQKNGHMDIYEIYEKIRLLYPSISLATVYKNISTMCEVNILREIKAPNHKQKYELSCDRHIHLACEKCGKLQDIHIDTSTLESVAEKNSGYKLYDTSAVLIGICPECQNY